MTKYADDAAAEAAKKAMEADKKLVEQSRSDYAERSKGKPTPTQDELDMANMGVHILEHDDDGSGPDPNVRKQVEADKSTAKPATYSTRQSTAKTE